jgi:GTP-binding protein Era
MRWKKTNVTDQAPMTDGHDETVDEADEGLDVEEFEELLLEIDDELDDDDEDDEDEDEEDPSTAGAVLYDQDGNPYVRDDLFGDEEEVGTFRSGFCTIVGRPNVGKSTLVNQMVGDKVSIVSSKPNTTRFQVRGIYSTEDAQVIFVDTPGLHKPKTTLGTRLNESALDALSDVDVVVAMVEAGSAIGPGDKMVLERAIDAVGNRSKAHLKVVVNKVDKSGPEQVAERLLAVSSVVDELLAAKSFTKVNVDYFPVSAKTGKGAKVLVDHIIRSLPEGPAYYPTDVTTDSPEAVQLAELVREQLLQRTHDELPHSIACRVSEWEWPRVKVEILVERDSQKGIVIGKGGAVLHDVGVAVREAFAAEMFLELFVKVEKHWQRRDDALDRLGY